MAHKEFYTVQDVMSRYGIAHVTICRWLRTGVVEGRRQQLRPKTKPAWVLTPAAFESLASVIEDRDRSIKPPLREHMRRVRSTHTKEEHHVRAN